MVTKTRAFRAKASLLRERTFLSLIKTLLVKLPIWFQENSCLRFYLIYHFGHRYQISPYSTNLSMNHRKGPRQRSQVPEPPSHQLHMTYLFNRYSAVATVRRVLHQLRTAGVTNGQLTAVPLLVDTVTSISSTVPITKGDMQKFAEFLRGTCFNFRTFIVFGLRLIGREGLREGLRFSF